MTTTLHLGVLDMPYGKAGSKTTGDVATILEVKYGLFSVFAETYAPVIQHNIENSLRGYLETAQMRGGQFTFKRKAAFAGAMSAIEEDFRDAIDKQVFDFKIPGVPTAAALAGVRHSLKSPRSRKVAVKRGTKTVGGPRPSFFDTGLMVSSFRAWVDD